MDLALSHNKQVVLFPTSEITAGVSIKLLGDFRSTQDGCVLRCKTLANMCGANNYRLLVPEHGHQLAVFTTANDGENQVDIAVPGDIAIYGNSNIGKLCLVHCSWLTLSMDIIPRTIAMLMLDTEMQLVNIKVFIYPGICQNCYEIKSDAREKFFEHKHRPYFQKVGEESWMFNLSGIIKHQLLEFLIKKNDIISMPSCSAHSTMRLVPNVNQNVFYSYRARNDDRRNAVFAKLPDDDNVIIAGTGDCPYVIFYIPPK